MNGRQPTVGDLFSGAGLFSGAAQMAGLQLKFAIELDQVAASSYAKNVGRHVSVGSVEAVDVREKVDVILAGPPCQGFSTLGRRDPKDVRNRLCLAVPQWVKGCDAQVAVVENVPQFLDSDAWLRMREEFWSLGFEVSTWLLDAADYGVPQHRRRSFTIASRLGLPEFPVATPHRRSVTEAFAGICANDPMHIWPQNSLLAEQRMICLPRCGDRRDLLSSAPALCPPSWARLGNSATDVWGRMNPSSPSNTIRCDFQNPSKGRYIHPSENRVISLREGARIQQVPDQWELLGYRTQIARQIGNGVPLGLGLAVARRIRDLF